MGVIINQSIKGTIISYIGVALGAFNILWLAPRYLDPEEIGLYNIVIQAATLLSMFGQLGTANIAIRFFPYFKSEDNKHRGFLGLLLSIATLGFIVFGTFYVLFKDFILSFYVDNAPRLGNYFYVVLVLAFFMVYHMLAEAFTRLQLKIVFVNSIREIFFRLGFAFLIILVGLDIIIMRQFIHYYTGLYLMGALLVFWYIWHLRQLHLTVNIRSLGSGLLKEISSYGFYIILGGAGSIIANKIDILMIGALATLDSAGIYTIAFFIGTIIEMPRRSIAQVATPLIAQSLKEDMGHVQELYYKSALNQFIIGMLLFIGIWTNIDSLFYIIPNSEIYILGKYVVLFIGLSKVFDMATGLNSEIIMNSRYYRFNFLLLVVFGLITAITNYIFIPLYGINGAAFATMLSVLFYNIIKYLFLWNKFGLQCFSVKFIYIIVISAIAYVLGMIVPNIPGSFIEIILRSTIISASFIFLILFFNISEDLTNIYRNFTSRFKH